MLPPENDPRGNDPATPGAVEHYRTLFKNIMNGVAYCKVLADGPPPHDFVFLEVNDAFEAQTGLKDATGKKASEVIPGIREQDPWVLDLYAEVARTGQPRKFERFMKALGEWFTVSVYSPEPGHFVAVFDETTDAHAATRTLRESEELFRVAFEHASTGMALLAPDGRPLRVNQVLCEMLGYSNQELLESNWRVLTHPDDLEASEREHRRVVEDPEQGGRQEKRYIRKDGSVLWADATTRAVLGPNGKITHFISSVMDITTRTQATEALRESERRFRQLADEIPVGIYQTRPAGDIEYVNPAWLEITGLSEAEAFGPDPGKAIHPEDRERVTRLWQDAITSRRSFSGEYRLRSRDGKETWVRGFGTAVRDTDGAITSYVGVLIDISEARRLQLELAQASRLAAMGTLVAGVAHEINNPLAATMANQGLALDVVKGVREARGTGPSHPNLRVHGLDEGIEALADAQESGERIAQIVRDLATFANPNPMRTVVRLSSIVEGAMRWLPVAMGQSMKVEVEAVESPQVMGAAGQLEQVVHNLLTNAARASSEGHGVIRVRTGPGSPGMVRLEVIDQGVGIPEKDLDRIFEPFFTTRPAGEGRGAGLGLAISRAIIAAHGGNLTVKSEVGKGSTFTVELPAAPAEA